MMLTKMTDMAIKEMDTFYATSRTMMDYFEKQYETMLRLNLWAPDACKFPAPGFNMPKPLAAAMGMVPESEYRTLELQSAEMAEQLDRAEKEVQAHQKTITDQALSFNRLKKQNDASEAETAKLQTSLAEQTALTAELEMKLQEATQALEKTKKDAVRLEKALEEKEKMLARQEKDLEKRRKSTEKMEKEITSLKKQIKDLKAPSE
jgi:chromosome segregation ATPase